MVLPFLKKFSRSAVDKISKLAIIRAQERKVKPSRSEKIVTTIEKLSVATGRKR